MNVPLWLWFAVIAAVLIMLLVDLVAHRHAHVIGVREAAAWSVVWMFCGVGFGGLIWWWYGGELGQQYFAGYLIEKSLAVDNVFVWAIIFSYFAVPRQYQHRVLFLGVLVTQLMRASEREAQREDRRLDRLDAAGAAEPAPDSSSASAPA